MLSRAGRAAESRDAGSAGLNVRPATGSSSRCRRFSGGNQQKILFAKWLRLDPAVLLLDEPTQGVDVGAKAALHRQILAAADAGAWRRRQLLRRRELEAVCHRVLVMRDGRIAAEPSWNGQDHGPNMTPRVPRSGRERSYP